MLLSEEPQDMCVFAKYSICFMGAWARSDKPQPHNQYTGVLSIQAHRAHKLGDRIFGEYYKTIVPSSGWCMLSYMKNNISWMACHPFHMLCGCMHKAWQAWDMINTLRSFPSKPRAHKLWDQILRELQNHQAIIMIEYVVK